MRQIGTIANEDDATRFSAFLLTLGIPNTAEESSGGWDVWVENDDHLERAAAELEKFRADPSNLNYVAAANAARKLSAEQQKEAERRRRNFIDVRTQGSQTKQSAAPFTLFLIGVCVLVGMLTHVWEGRRNEILPIVNKLYIAPIEVEEGYIMWDHLDAIFKRGEVWRLITPIFMHADLLHILFNMMWLFSFGMMIETRRGTPFFVILVLVIAIVSDLVQYYWHGPMFLGMSGVNYGLFGYIWIKGRYDPAAGMGLSQQTVTIMLVWLVACMTGFLGPVANAAHLAGLVAGAAIAYTPHLVKQMRR